MAERLTLRVFKGPAKDAFRNAFEGVVTQHAGSVAWEDTSVEESGGFRASHNRDVHAVHLPYEESGADYLLCVKIGERLSIPWLELRVQEGSLWDYSLYSGSTHLDNFSTLPEYWGEDEEWNATQQGNSRLLAEAWRLDQSRIERYVRYWGYVEDEDEGGFNTLLRGKAYRQDEHEYGDIWQMLDFLRALGAVDPMTPGREDFYHRMVRPPWESLRRE
jgi:hypothetical protein